MFLLHSYYNTSKIKPTVTPITPKSFLFVSSSLKISEAKIVTAAMDEAFIAFTNPIFGAVLIPSCINKLNAAEARPIAVKSSHCVLFKFFQGTFLIFISPRMSTVTINIM